MQPFAWICCLWLRISCNKYRYSALQQKPGAIQQMKFRLSLAPLKKLTNIITIMKSFRGIALLILGAGIFLTWNGCKKGPEDPFFSIWSRKHRVVGDWQIVSYRVDDKDSLRRVIDSSSIVGACGPEVDKEIHYYDAKWSFDKDGNFSQNLKILIETTIDIVNNTAPCPDVVTLDSTIAVTVKNWNFTGKVGDVKNKEQLLLFDPETKETVIYDIIELREKEMKLETEVIDPVTNTATIEEYTLESIK